MVPFEEFASALVATAWRMSWQVAVLVVLVFVATRLLRSRLSARWVYCLWGLVVLRLALPVSPRLGDWAIDWDDATRAVEVNAPLEKEAVLEPSGMRSSPGRLGPLRSNTESESTRASKPEQAEVTHDGGSADVTPVPFAQTSPPAARTGLRDLALQLGSSRAKAATLRWTTWVFLAWLVVAALKASLVLIRESAFRRKLRMEPELDAPRLRALLDECRADLNMTRKVRLIQSDLTSSPALSGWRRPLILLPAHAVQLEDDELRGVLLHEVAHAKHADVPANALFALLDCVWWFHPLVGFALGELRAAREAVRDREALSTPRSPAPRSYAETLLALAEARPRRTRFAPGFSFETRETRRRIQMIADFRTYRPATQALGAVLFLGLAWLTFTSAAATKLEGVEPSVNTQASVQVVRHQPEPAWRAALEAVLDKTLSVEFDHTPCVDVIEFLRQQTGANFIVRDQLFEDYSASEFSAKFQDARVRDVLDALCRSVDAWLTFAVTERVIYLGERGNIPSEYDLRFYKVEPLLQALDGEDEGMDSLIDLVRCLAAPESWDSEGVNIEAWNGLLLVTQTHEGHKSVQSLLDRMLRGGAQDLPDEELRTGKFRQKLSEEKTSVKFENVTVREALEQLSQATGIVMNAEDDFADQEFSLQLNDVSIDEILHWIARPQGAHVVVSPTAVRLSVSEPCDLEFYDLKSLRERAEDVDELEDSLVQLIRTQVEPALWDENPSANLLFWDHYMLVRASKSAHAGIACLLLAIEEVTK